MPEPRLASAFQTVGVVIVHGIDAARAVKDAVPAHKPPFYPPLSRENKATTKLTDAVIHAEARVYTYSIAFDHISRIFVII